VNFRPQHQNDHWLSIALAADRRPLAALLHRLDHLKAVTNPQVFAPSDQPKPAAPMTPSPHIRRFGVGLHCRRYDVGRSTEYQSTAHCESGSAQNLSYTESDPHIRTRVSFHHMLLMWLYIVLRSHVRPGGPILFSLCRKYPVDTDTTFQPV